ncbi:MAG TPA: PEPxxWA-CTERM sorting domain-containing protein, partial [Phenylobacterium sp.]|nr:PEPxxWA-CTERM sorting domain-containing protein [Phenylobacterium sp.]
VALALMPAAASAAVVATVEAPGVFNTTASFSSKGVETFNSRPTGTAGFSSSFAGQTGTTITGVYSANTEVHVADQFGGQGGTNYAVTFTNAGYSLQLNQEVTYFGFYLPALDSGNQLTLLDNGVSVFTFSPAALLALVGGNSAYFGKPDQPLQGGDNGEPFAFVNFFATGTTKFDQIVFKEDPQVGGYESDNHTVGFWTTQTGTTIGVPEPTTWAMMILGLGGAGVMLRANRRRFATAA